VLTVVVRVQLVLVVQVQGLIEGREHLCRQHRLDLFFW
jgi:hypothetical protein